MRWPKYLHMKTWSGLRLFGKCHGFLSLHCCSSPQQGLNTRSGTEELGFCTFGLEGFIKILLFDVDGSLPFWSPIFRPLKDVEYRPRRVCMLLQQMVSVYWLDWELLFDQRVLVQLKAIFGLANYKWSKSSIAGKSLNSSRWKWLVRSDRCHRRGLKWVIVIWLAWITEQKPIHHI